MTLLRGQGTILRPLGYEPSELPTAPPHNIFLCPRRDSNSHAFAYRPKRYVYTNFTTRACLSREQESNLQPIDYKSIALPIELSRHLMFRCKSRALLVHYKRRGFLLDKNLYLQELRSSGWARTSDPLINSQMLLPAELIFHNKAQEVKLLDLNQLHYNYSYMLYQLS